MVDAVDSKSTLGNQVLVRVRPSAISRMFCQKRQFIRLFFIQIPSEQVRYFNSFYVSATAMPFEDLHAQKQRPSDRFLLFLS